MCEYTGYTVSTSEPLVSSELKANLILHSRFQLIRSDGKMREGGGLHSFFCIYLNANIRIVFSGENRVKVTERFTEEVSKKLKVKN